MIDDLFENKLKPQIESNPQIGIFDIPIPTNLQEYSKIVINNEKSEIIYGDIINILPSNPNLLKDINAKSFYFHKEQVDNLVKSMSDVNKIDDDFIRNVVDEKGVIKPLSPDIFVSFSAINDFYELYTILNKGFILHDVVILPQYQDLFANNMVEITKLKENVNKVKDFISENFNDIQNRIK
jgi:hypothetical protein